MSILRIQWKDVSIVKKLYLVVGVMAFLIAGELVTLRFAMHTLSAARAFVEGEGTWSKAQKNAIFALQRFGISGDEKDCQQFQDYLKVSEGDHQARIEMGKANADPNVIRQGFLQGRVHPDDIQPMVDLLTRFYWISYLSRSIQAWTQADLMIAELKEKAMHYHEAIQKRDGVLSNSIMLQIKDLDFRISGVEDEFSASLGAGSRWLERVVLSLLLLAVISVEGVGLTLAVFTSRRLSKGLKELDQSAARIGAGNFEEPVPVRSKDEIGRLSEALDHMRGMLQGSYLELEARVATRTKELNEALAYRDEFLSIASHELRTPLTAMHLQLQLLERRMEPKLVQGALDRSRSFKVLLDELFDLTKLRAGRLELNLNHIDLKPLLLEIVNTLQAEADAQGSHITLTLPEGVNPTLEGDPMRIGQVITNLVSNAIKYGNGTPTRVECVIDENEVQISVSDEGKGIDAEHVDRIFERFERANDDPNVTGLGLGLYISKHIVDAHGGKIEVKSTLGKGACFIVHLPRQKAS